MKRQALGVSISFMLMLVLMACAQPSSQGSSGSANQSPRVKKQITAGINSAPIGFFQEITNPTGSPASVPGLQETYQLVNGTLTYTDLDSNRHEWLAEAVPTTDNGLWKVEADGRMETTWRIKQGTKWHDGVAMTSDDLRFTMDVYRDKDVGTVPLPELGMVEGVDTPDAQTITLRWQRPLITADSMFGGGITMWPLPQHLLEQAYNDNKAGLLSLPYWQESFVGTGPFKVQDWARDSYVVLVANDDYVLGRPHIDQV